jgi:hypothetical protein
MYSWTITKLVEGVLGAKKAGATEPESPPPEGAGGLQESLDNFLRRIYFEFRNLGLLPQDRAINFAGTQIFPAVAAVSATALLRHIQLQSGLPHGW